MSSPYADLDRPPLAAAALTRTVAGGLWREVRVLPETASTNADAAEAARGGEPGGLVVVAERQTAGRGRLGRVWEAPARAGLTFSVLLRPAAPVAAWGLLPLLAGTAVVEALRAVTELGAGLKWPNDVLGPSGGKLGGLLAERVSDAAPGDAVVVGVGLNVTTRREELPVPTATSLALEGSETTDRAVLLKEILRSLERRYDAWVAANGAPEAVLPAYRDICETIGRRVRVELPGGAAVVGEAVAVDDSGRLVVRDDTGSVRPWSAGDVVHLRAEG